MTESAVTRFHKFVAASSAGRRELLLVLSLTGPRNISQLTELVGAAGLRQSWTRRYSTGSLRPILEALIQQGLAVQADSVFDCARLVRELSLREAAERGMLDKVATAIRTAAHPYLRYSNQGTEAAWFDFRVALQRGDLHNAATLLDNCATYDWERFVQDNPLVQAICEPFDPAWLQKFRPRDGALVAWALDHANRSGLPSYDLYPWLCKHVSQLAADAPALHLLLAEAALLRGDQDVVEAQLKSSALSQTAPYIALSATLALLRDQDVLALDGFEKASGLLQGQSGKKKSVVPLARLFALFHGLLLLRHGKGDDYVQVARQAGTCQRDTSYEFHDSAVMLKNLADAAIAPSQAEHARHLLLPVKASDCMSLLLRGLYAAWFPVSDGERGLILPYLVQASDAFAAGKYIWLCEQYRWVTHRLNESLKNSLQSTSERWRETKHFSVPPCPERKPNQRPLVDLFDVKPGWRLALQALEQLAGNTRESRASDAAQQRIAWRVQPESCLIEAILQKRSRAGWSSGRKVAVKQLLPDGAQYALLGEQDRQVTAHIREEICRLGRTREP